MSFLLEIKSANNQSSRREILPGQSILIGRSKICDLTLEDTLLSRQHCSLELKAQGRIELKDLKSANGVFLNGKKIAEEILKEGDRFQIGQTEIHIVKAVLEDEAEEKTPTLTEISVVPEPVETSAQPLKVDPKVQPMPDKRSSVAPTESKPLRKEAPPDIELTLKTPVFFKPDERSKVLYQTKEWIQVSLLWKEDLVDLQCFERGDIVKIGTDESNDFVLSLSGLPGQFQFLKILPNGVELHLHPAMKGLVELKDKVIELDQLRANARQTSLGLSTLVPFTERCLIEIGPFAFYIQTKKLSLSAPLSAPFIREPQFAGILAACILFMLVFLTGISGIEVPPKEIEKPAENTVTLAPPTEAPSPLPTPKPVPPPPAVKTGEKKSEKVQLSGKEGAGAKATGEVGKSGRTTGTVNTRARAIGMVTKSDRPLKSIPKGAFGKDSEGAKGARPDQGVGSGKPKPAGTGGQAPSKQIKPNVNVEDMGISGVIASRGGGGKGASGTVSGTGLGGEIEGSVEGLERGSDINSKGSGGRGAKGLGLGGGGTSLEVGGLSTQGKGGGKTGFGLGSSGNKGDADVSYSAEDVEVRDGLTREEIERVVRANERDIQTCYERALIQSGAKIGGRLKVGWFVNRDGRVERVVQESGFSGSDVLFSCIAERLRTWQFPKPRGGSGAQVSWPWVFKKG